MELHELILPLITLTSSFVIANILNLVLEKLRRRAETTETKLDDIILHAIGRLLYILVIVAGLYYAIHQTPYLGELINRFDEGYRLVALADMSAMYIIWLILVWIKHYDMTGILSLTGFSGRCSFDLLKKV
ncbi:MAG: hypothetical protein Q8O41_00245 [Candidatus Methanoperedens sp.]|nr:hypothetical protein [Candidatus Methanoperedens sp.]